MSMKLLPASVNSVDQSLVPDVSNSLSTLAQRSLTSRLDQTSLDPSIDTFTSSSRPRQSGVKWIDATPVEDSQTDESAFSHSEYVSGWSWSSPVERTAIAHYLSYAAASPATTGQYINLYG